MTTKKSTKSSKSDPVKEAPPVVSGPSVRLKTDPIMPAKKYLMSIGTRPHRVAPMAVWAKGKGFAVATVSQWKTLFESY